MKPLVHAMTAAKRFGGVWTDYVAVHSFIDQSKAAVATNHHRALFHNDWGIEAATAAFGANIRNADGADVPTAALVERHCVEDHGFVPTVERWMERNVRLPAYFTTRVRLRHLDAIRDDPATGFAERYGGSPALYAPMVAFWDAGARRSGRNTSAIAALTLNSATIVAAETAFGVALAVPGRKAPVAVREIGELMALSRWGVVPSLHHVVGGIVIEDWMRGRCAGECRKGQSCPAEEAAMAG